MTIDMTCKSVVLPSIQVVALPWIKLLVRKLVETGKDVTPPAETQMTRGIGNSVVIVHQVWLSSMANARFVDEGKDFINYTYAEFGRQILLQPEIAGVNRVYGVRKEEYGDK